MTEKILLRNVEVEGSTKLATYESRGGYQALRKALRTSPSLSARSALGK